MYLDRADEILHHSCASLVKETGEDLVQIDTVVRLMVAVSMYNRDIDISECCYAQNSLMNSAFAELFFLPVCGTKRSSELQRQKL